MNQKTHRWRRRRKCEGEEKEIQEAEGGREFHLKSSSQFFLLVFAVIIHSTAFIDFFFLNYEAHCNPGF